MELQLMSTRWIRVWLCLHARRYQIHDQGVGKGRVNKCAWRERTVGAYPKEGSDHSFGIRTEDLDILESRVVPRSSCSWQHFSKCALSPTSPARSENQDTLVITYKVGWHSCLITFNNSTFGFWMLGLWLPNFEEKTWRPSSLESFQK